MLCNNNVLLIIQRDNKLFWHALKSAKIAHKTIIIGIVKVKDGKAYFCRKLASYFTNKLKNVYFLLDTISTIFVLHIRQNILNH